MATSSRGSVVTSIADVARPLPSRTPGRITNPYPGVSFRSSLLRAQQRYPLAASRTPNRSGPAQTPASPSSDPPNPVNGIAQGAALAVPAAQGLTPLGKTAIQNPNPPSVESASLATVATAASAGIDGRGGVGKPMALSDFPRPEGDNGRGMHWVPITHSASWAVDRFVKEAKDMKVKWMVILNDDAKVGENDYLVKKLVDNGIMPVMRLYTPHGRPIQGDIGALVRHYKPMGVNYYQLYNEPNLNVENPDGIPNVDRYLDTWIPGARAVAEAGGLPGLGALSPGGNFDDIEFLKQTLDKIKERGEIATLDKAWLSMHNYTLNHPLDYAKDSNAFMKFKWYDTIIKEKLGRQMPIIGTEGGTHIGSADDKTFPPIDEAKQIDMVTGAYRYMKNREPYNFVYTYWIIANEEGGGSDTAFSHQALFKRTGQSPLVDALKRLD
ncbi:MAG: hypothetical protein M1358_22075 [Chloroflexi bacterium]|nr:hypothetical protein [Chloroflexota bacterium]